MLTLWSLGEISFQIQTLKQWNGKVLIYDSDRMKLKDAQLTCNDFFGHLPFVHSSDDVDEIGHFGEYIWLGAKPEDKNSSDSLDVYEWSDGSPFDYRAWHSSHPPCKGSCCAVALYPDDNVGNRMVTTECLSTNSMVCILPTLSNVSSDEFGTIYSRLMFNGIFDRHRVRDYLQQVSIDILEKRAKELAEQATQLEEQLNESILQVKDKLKSIHFIHQESINAVNETTLKIESQNEESKFQIAGKFSSLQVCLWLIAFFLLLHSVVLFILFGMRSKASHSQASEIIQCDSSDRI